MDKFTEFDITNSDNWIFVSNTNQSKSISINKNNQIEKQIKPTAIPLTLGGG